MTLEPQREQTPILVVDDDAEMRDLVALALRRAGYDVIIAGSGPDALRIVEAQAIGMIVLDMAVPGMSGMEVVEALRARPETSTLPVLLMTSSGDENSVIRGLEAGADDFLPKPVRLDELVARVRSHLRSQAAWSNAAEHELRGRVAVVAALGQLTLSAVPEKAADTVVRELSGRTGNDFVGVTQLAEGDRLIELATYNRVDGVRIGGAVLPSAIAADLVGRARSGPWVEEIGPVIQTPRSSAFAPADLDLVAGAPIYSGGELVGLLSLGVRDTGRSRPARKAALLAAAIDYAGVLSAVAGSAIADRRDIGEVQSRLQAALTAHEFHPVFQPIVDLQTLALVGYEALTRFADGTRPDVRFATATRVGMGADYEIAALGAALDEEPRLAADAFLALNVSPSLVLEGSRQVVDLLAKTARPIVLELTEHVPIDDYVALRVAIARLGDVGIAVDDAGAGYASLRHILELRPAFAKLDISLVHGIDGDELRQAIAAGLQYFAVRTGCRLIAEGVESQAEADALRGLGVELAQGYLFGRPEQIAHPLPN